MKKILLTVTGFIAVAMLFTGVGYAAATWLNFTGDEQIKQSESDIDKIMKILEDTHDGKLSAERAYDELEAMNPKGLVDQIKTLKKSLGEKDKIIANHVSEAEKLEKDNSQLTTELAAANQAKTEAEKSLGEKDKIIANHVSEIEKLKQEIASRDETIVVKNGEIEKLEQDIAAKEETIVENNSEIENLKGEKAILATDLASANKAKTDAENALEGKQEELNNKQAEIEAKQVEIEAKQVEINDKNQAYEQLKQQRDTIAAERDSYKAQVGEKDNYVKHLEAELEKANIAAKSVSDKTTEALEKAETYK